jgi:hypothetical protein
MNDRDWILSRLLFGRENQEKTSLRIAGLQIRLSDLQKRSQVS